MIIYVGKDYQDVSRKAANIMSAQIINSLSSGTTKATLISHRSHL